MPARTYPWEQYVEVVDILARDLGARVVLTGADARASRVLRSRVCSLESTEFLTTCMVIVEPPCSIPPYETFSNRARTVARRLTPSWL